MKRITVILIVFLATTLYSFAQNNKALDTSTVENQFRYIIDNSPNSFDSKLVKLNWINQLKNNVIDSVSTLTKLQLTNTDIINAQKITLDSLKNEFESSLTSFDTLNLEKQSISFLGINFDKSTFKKTMLSIIIILILILVFYIRKYNGSNTITEDFKQRLIDLQEEFDASKQRSLEREQITMRKLQDELNKKKEK
ncbi:hypothetical protein [Lutibacter sp.]|uniref:hypothetical protein n=1 Tax=Lutibacter sp. TaxID=1925666 RepID=UPI002734036F|nr:hypothetical protein [Lutibacter sp.]MDP3313554.1 hypothetical protein [Lutibacter sp.]